MMIELIEDSGSLTVINTDQIVYVKNDDGSAIVKLSTNETIIVDSYDDAISRLQMSGMQVYLDKETREKIDALKGPEDIEPLDEVETE